MTRKMYIRKGSTAERTIDLLAGLPRGCEVTTAYISSELGANPNNLKACLEWAIDRGYLRYKSHGVGRTAYWSLGDVPVERKPPRRRRLEDLDIEELLRPSPAPKGRPVGVPNRAFDPCLADFVARSTHRPAA